MTDDGKRESKLIRVGDPLIRVKMKFPPLDSSEGPVTDGPLIRVGDPLIRVKLTFQPVDPAEPEPTPDRPAGHEDAGSTDRPADLADVEPAG